MSTRWKLWLHFINVNEFILERCNACKNDITVQNNTMKLMTNLNVWGINITEGHSPLALIIIVCLMLLKFPLKSPPLDFTASHMNKDGAVTGILGWAGNVWQTNLCQLVHGYLIYLTLMYWVCCWWFKLEPLCNVRYCFNVALTQRQKELAKSNVCSVRASGILPFIY